MNSAPLSMVYRCEKQTSKLAQQLKNFYSCGEFCDVILYSRTSQIHAHRIILAAFSPYFYHSIHRNTDRRNIAEIQLRSYDDRIVKAVIDFFYNGVITVDSDSAEQIFSLANTLQVKEVEKLCLTFLNAQQSFASEIEQERKPRYDGAMGRYCYVEPSKVESSSRSSPRTSPSVSTSGRPLSDSGSVDSDVVTIKTEVQDFEDDYRDYYREDKKENNGGKVKLMKSIVDMSQVTPKLSGQPVYPSQYMFVRPSPPPPPALQMMAPQKGASKATDTEMAEINEVTESTTKDKTFQPGNDVSFESNQPDAFPAVLDSMFECHICKQIFGAKHLLEIHMVSGHGMGGHYKYLNQRRKKQRISPGEVNSDYAGALPCDTCGKFFRDAQSLKFHQYNHVLRFSCNVCGKRFSRSWNLHRHAKTHGKFGDVILENGGDDSMHTEYVDEISSDMVDLTSTGEEDGEGSLNTSQDLSIEKSDEEKTAEESESKATDDTSS